MSVTPILRDAEVEAVNAIATTLEAIDPEARKRVINWAYARFVTTDTDDEPTPRTFWLDEMPATGDLFSLDGRDLPVTDVTISYEDTGLTWSMVAVRLAERDDEGSAA